MEIALTRLRLAAQRTGGVTRNNDDPALPSPMAGLRTRRRGRFAEVVAAAHLVPA